MKIKLESKTRNRIGFIQGRLSPMVQGKIQAFPWEYWKKEFELAQQNDFSVMEWTIDSLGFHDNPLLTVDGRIEIDCLKKRYGIKIPSLTGDCFMQSPFYKTSGKARVQLLNDLSLLIESCAKEDIRQILIPLVDDGRVENWIQEDCLIQGLVEMETLLDRYRIAITFESDLPPNSLAEFIDKWNPSYFGITYDTGNSAALGYHPVEEIRAYGNRIVNVHIKDRMFKGETVPLGKGNADIPLALKLILSTGYTGNFILQTARADDDDHTGVLMAYKSMVEAWLAEGMA